MEIIGSAAATPHLYNAKVVAKSWFRYSRVLFNFPYSKFFAATSTAGTFYRTARSLLVRAQMMVRAMSSCSSCSAWRRTGRGEYVRTCLMRNFPPGRFGTTHRDVHTATCAYKRFYRYLCWSSWRSGPLSTHALMPDRPAASRSGPDSLVVQRCRFGSATIHGLWRKWGQLDYVVCESFITHPDRLPHRMISH